MSKIYVFLMILLVSFAYAKEPISDIQVVSEKVQALKEYAIPRTVGIRIIIGDRFGYGSGAIVSADGIIMTCAHVVEPAESLVVVMSDNTEYPARRLGTNSVNDYALIKIDGKDFPYFEYGNSDEISMLQWVVALGHPGGPYEDQQPAIASGRVRGLHKKLPIQLGVKFYDDAIQTDVPIFAGNSGGPLIDLEGKLIGINGAIMLVNDLAFSVPINEILQDLTMLKSGRDVEGRSPGNIFDIFSEMQEDFSPEDMLKAFDKSPLGKIFKMFSGMQQTEVKKPTLGITVREVQPKGLQVTNVEVNKLGSLAGLKAGDIILKANGIPVELREDLFNIIASLPVTGKMFINVNRDGNEMRLPVFLSSELYSRDHHFRRQFVYKGLELMDTTVKLRNGKKMLGYGVVISPDGWILTAEHIISKEKGAIDVIMQDGSRKNHIGIVKGRNPVWDIALIKVTPENNMNYMEMGDDHDLKIGEWLISGGTTDGIVQAGMLSAVDRKVSEDRRVPTLGMFGMFGQPNKSPVRAYDNVLQHDTNLEGDHFGTPLVNMKGELIGVNVAYFYRGTAFAIPISTIKTLLADLKDGKQITVSSRYQARPAEKDPLSKILHRFFGGDEESEEEGEQSDPINDILKDLFGSGEQPKGFIGVQVQESIDGVKVMEAVPGKPAAQAGVQQNDVITHFAAVPIKTIDDLLATVGERSPGEKTTITIVRNGKTYNLPITIGER